MPLEINEQREIQGGSEMSEAFVEIIGGILGLANKIINHGAKDLGAIRR